MTKGVMRVLLATTLMAITASTASVFASNVSYGIYGNPNGNPIPDGGTLVLTGNVTGSQTIEDLFVQVLIPHDNPQDLINVILESPSGTQVELINAIDMPGSVPTVVSIGFKGNGLPYNRWENDSNTNECAPLGGGVGQVNEPGGAFGFPFQAFGSLEAFVGESVQGVWKLYVTDADNNGDVGDVEGVELVLYDDTTVGTSCDMNFVYDSADYNYNERFFTYCPENSGEYLSVTVNDFDVPCTGASWTPTTQLLVYNGNGMGESCGGEYIGNELLGTFCDDETPDEIISTSPDGCLTFVVHRTAWGPQQQAVPFSFDLGLTCDACGDGQVQAREDCDDGNNVDDDACNNNCEETTCGDSIVQSGEGCDDGNFENADECSNSCELTFCGDGIWQTQNGDGSGGEIDDGQEECDDGAENGPDGSCDVDCTLNDNPGEPYCGDGIVDPGEECDDGGLADGNNYDECTNRCTIPACGDGVVLSGSFTPRPNSGVSGGGSGVGGDGGHGGMGGMGGMGGSTSSGNNTGCYGLPDGICDPKRGENSATCIADCGPAAFSGYHEACDDGTHCLDGTACQENSDCLDGSACVPRDGDGCSSICTLEYCGDGLINNIDEACDSGTGGSRLGCDMNTGIPGGGPNPDGAYGELKNSCTWIVPECTLSASPEEFYLNGTADLYFTHTPVASGMTLSDMNYGDGSSQSITSSPMSHSYTDSGAYLARFTVTNVGTSALAETCSDNVYVYRCGDGFQNGPEECDGIGQAQCGDGSTCGSSCTCIINGECGVASGANYYSTTGGNGLSGGNTQLCEDGTTASFTYNSGTKKRSWTCLGINGGSNMACNANNTYCGDNIVQANKGEACDGHEGCTNSCAWDVPTCDLDISDSSILLSGSTTFDMTYPSDSWFHITRLNFDDGRDAAPSTNPMAHTYDVVGTFTPTFKVINKGNGNISTTCTGSVVVDYPCGDGVASPGEECNEPGVTCSVGIACNTITCLCEPEPPLTGDNEDCDVGQLNDDNSRCNSSCNYTYCGDGRLQDQRWIYSGNVYFESGAFINYVEHGYSGGQWVHDTEECDGQCSNGVTCLEDSDCQNIGDGLCQKRSGLGCSDTCSWELCGDEIVQTPNYFGVNEICDEGRGRYCSDGTECTGHPEACPLGPSDCSPYFIDNCAATCEADRCGDGVVNLANGEECDYADGDPRQNANAFCFPAEYNLTGVGLVSCQRTYCGDGIVQNVNIGGYTNADGFNESCDDANSDNGDGCSNTCTLNGSSEGICNLGGSEYDADAGGNGIIPNGTLCLNPITFDPSSFEYNSSTHTWTWDCLDLPSGTVGESCSVEERYCGDNIHDQEEDCEPSLNAQCASNCTSDDTIGNCNEDIVLPYLSGGSYDTGDIIATVTNAIGGACRNGTWNGTVYQTGGGLSDVRGYMCYGSGVGGNLHEECILDAHYCGDGIMDVSDDGNDENDEECDDGDAQNDDGCSSTCTIELPLDVPFSGSCIAEGFEDDPEGIGYLPQINNDEYLPIWWQLINRNDVDLDATTCADINVATSERIPGRGMQCTFEIVRAGASDYEAVYEFTDNCLDANAGRWNGQSAPLFDELPIDSDGVTALGTTFLDPATVLGFVEAHFGQYRLNLKEAAWTFCNIDTNGVIIETDSVLNTNPNANPSANPPIAEEPICAMNLSISDGYLVQKGSSLIEVPNTDIGSTFMSLEGVNLVVEGTPLDEAVNQISQYSDEGREHLVNQIIEKYDRLALERDEVIPGINSSNIRKVPTSAIYFIDDGNDSQQDVVTLDTLDILELKNTFGQDSFVFVMPNPGSRLIINGSLGTDSFGNIDEGTSDGMYVVNGTIEFSHGEDCVDTDYVAGIFIASDGFDTTLTSNTDLQNPQRCSGGNLVIKGLLVGAQADLDAEFSILRRSTLDAWQPNSYLFDDSLVGQARKTFETCYLPALLAGAPTALKMTVNGTTTTCNNTNWNTFRDLANKVLLGLETFPGVPSIPTGNPGRNHICRAYYAAYNTPGALQPVVITDANGDTQPIPFPIYPTVPALCDDHVFEIPAEGEPPLPLTDPNSIFNPTGPWYRQAIRWMMLNPTPWQCKRDGNGYCEASNPPLPPLGNLKSAFEKIGNIEYVGPVIRLKVALYNGKLGSPSGMPSGNPSDVMWYTTSSNSGYLLSQETSAREGRLFEGASVLIETNPDLWRELPEVANEFLRNLQISR